MELPSGGLERAVSPEDLHGARINTCVQEMGGKAVSQRVNATAMGNPRPPPGADDVDLTRGAPRHGVLGGVAGQEPGRGPLESPIGAQFLQESAGEEGQTILFAFALVDANEHPLWSALDVGDLEADHFTDAQAAP